MFSVPDLLDILVKVLGFLLSALSGAIVMKVYCVYVNKLSITASWIINHIQRSDSTSNIHNSYHASGAQQNPNLQGATFHQGVSFYQQGLGSDSMPNSEDNISSPQLSGDYKFIYEILSEVLDDNTKESLFRTLTSIIDYKKTDHYSNAAAQCSAIVNAAVDNGVTQRRVFVTVISHLEKLESSNDPVIFQHAWSELMKAFRNIRKNGQL